MRLDPTSGKNYAGEDRCGGSLGGAGMRGHIGSGDRAESLPARVAEHARRLSAATKTRPVRIRPLQRLLLHGATPKAVGALEESGLVHRLQEHRHRYASPKPFESAPTVTPRRADAFL